jgi:hypothetical protein
VSSASSNRPHAANLCTRSSLSHLYSQLSLFEIERQSDPTHQGDQALNARVPAHRRAPAGEGGYLGAGHSLGGSETFLPISVGICWARHTRRTRAPTSGTRHPAPGTRQ